MDVIVQLTNTQLTGWVVLVCLLKGVHGNFSTSGQDGQVATQQRINSEMVVVIQTTTRLNERQTLVSRVEDHLCVARKPSTWSEDKPRVLSLLFVSYFTLKIRYGNKVSATSD